MFFFSVETTIYKKMFKGIYNKQTLTRTFDVIKHYLHIEKAD